MPTWLAFLRTSAASYVAIDQALSDVSVAQTLLDIDQLDIGCDMLCLDQILLEPLGTIDQALSGVGMARAY